MANSVIKLILGSLTGRSFTTTNCLRKELQGSQEKYTTIYNFPHVHVLATLNRIKLYYAGFSAAALPISGVAYALDASSVESVYITALLGVTGCMTLFGVGYLCKDLVGFVYINEKGDKIKVAYADMWGKRQDVEMLVNDVVPFTDIPFSITDRFFMKLKTYSSNENLKLNITMARIIDINKFNSVFYRF